MSAMADPHWAGLLRAALLGTERNPPPAAPEDGSTLSRALASASGETAEATLLSAAAILAAHRRASRTPARDDRPLGEPAAGETAPVCPPLAARHLAMMLEGSFAVALPEWMEAAARAGYIAPPELLPKLLEAASANPFLRRHLPNLLGERGRWLAAQSPEWMFALAITQPEAEEADDRATWETMSAEARPALLDRIRQRDPARGLALLQSTWATEAPRDRAALLQALATGLSMDDEPFLEAALDDRRKEVRTAAASILSRLADSRLVARMTERARRWLVIQPPKTGLLAKVTGGGAPLVEVYLPEALDKEMERDGIAAKPPPGVGERGWWLAQALAAVPPRTWTDAAKCSPDELIAAARKTEWRDVVVNGWAAATLRHLDAEWAQPLIARPEHSRWQIGGVDTSPRALLAVAPPAAAEAAMLAMIEPMRTMGEFAAHLVSGLEHPWSAELTHAVLRRSAGKDPAHGYMIRQSLSQVVPRMHPAAALAEIDAAPDAIPRAWVDLLHHRHAMLEALKR
ncbi:MAG TPA: DUF5691 domain-containing protein [Longimicrobium sp.]|nr:DUF5691 domain-containing protein [Longimicrobium sp.]